MGEEVAHFVIICYVLIGHEMIINQTISVSGALDMGRINLDFSEDKLKDIDRLMETGCISTKKDLFENSLTILRWMMRMRKEGRRVGALDNGNNFIELDMPILESAEKSKTEI